MTSDGASNPVPARAQGQHWTATQPEGDPPTPVQVSRADLIAAAQHGLITRAQAEALWQRWAFEHLASTPARAAAPVQPLAAPRFTAVNVLYYFGGMLAISAMTLFMTLSWQALGTWGVFGLGLLYLIGALKVADHLLGRQLRVPAGLMATLAICLVPLLVWCVQNALGLWPVGGPQGYAQYHTLIDWRWLTLEFATLAAGVVMLWRYKLPFMVMPLAVTIWYLSMDVANALLQQHGWDWQLTRDVSLVFGLGTCALAAWVDIRTRRATEPVWQQDFAFWLYLYGAIMFWGGLSLRDSGSELGKLLYALINVGLVFLGAALGRRIFTILGALGVAGYLGYLSHRVFKDSLLFPIFLSLLGLAVVALGVWWQRHEAQINARLRGWLPAALQPRD